MPRLTLPAMSLPSAIRGWILTALQFLEDKLLHLDQANAVVSGTTMSLYALICEERGAFGPSLVTGGIIHKITDAQAAQVATVLWNEVKKRWPDNPDFALYLTMMAAWIRGESRFDPNAYNPNNQVIPKGTTQTAEEIFMHTDIGWGQFDGTELGPMLPGLTWQEQMAKAYDVTWACPAHIDWAYGLVVWGKEQAAILASFDKQLAPNPYLLAFEAYNAGKSGALARALLAMGGTEVPYVIHDGSLVSMSASKTTDMTFTDTLMASLNGVSTMGYGNGLNTTWTKYKALLGPTPTLGTP